ncbi:hypothetical protein BCR43DRAFT_273760 [Syncephalastrum racemosum]|uniref:Uncharacterized protein n=1 Tax=Syncephalastrum racemosum TaxID=13706 RepID=A0A1X2HC45_SYNRA|nr:hypothetical protein BCR43DRAFT_273760 [Syncephalastrum racemosum]
MSAFKRCLASVKADDDVPEEEVKSRVKDLVDHLETHGSDSRAAPSTVYSVSQTSSVINYGSNSSVTILATSSQAEVQQGAQSGAQPGDRQSDQHQAESLAHDQATAHGFHDKVFRCGYQYFKEGNNFEDIRTLNVMAKKLKPSSLGEWVDHLAHAIISSSMSGGNNDALKLACPALSILLVAELRLCSKTTSLSGIRSWVVDD